jgi:hypothetical protein
VHKVSALAESKIFFYNLGLKLFPGNTNDKYKTKMEPGPAPSFILPPLHPPQPQPSFPKSLNSKVIKAVNWWPKCQSQTSMASRTVGMSPATRPPQLNLLLTRFRAESKRRLNARNARDQETTFTAQKANQSVVTVDSRVERYCP